MEEGKGNLRREGRWEFGEVEETEQNYEQKKKGEGAGEGTED